MHGLISSSRPPTSGTARLLQIGVAYQVGDWFISKYRRIARESSCAKTAGRLRKDGVPLDQSLLILLGAEERFTEFHQEKAAC